jgi:hypothetical protein
MNTKLSKATLDAINNEDGCATGLPNQAYTSEEFFRVEQQQLFAKTWTCIGNGCSVPEPGDLQPVGFLGQPLVMLRNKQGKERGRTLREPSFTTSAAIAAMSWSGKPAG